MDIRAHKLNDLVSVFYESLFRQHPDWPNLIPPADEPLGSWLAALADRYLALKR
jgi:hemoglobin-like flavoprotein